MLADILDERKPDQIPFEDFDWNSEAETPTINFAQSDNGQSVKSDKNVTFEMMR